MRVPKWAATIIVGVEVLMFSTCTYRMYKSDPTSMVARVVDLSKSERLVLPKHLTPVTAVCRDGSTSHSLHRRGTCSRHGGVESWGAPD